MLEFLVYMCVSGRVFLSFQKIIKEGDLFGIDLLKTFSLHFPWCGCAGCWVIRQTSSFRFRRQYKKKFAHPESVTWTWTYRLYGASSLMPVNILAFDQKTKFHFRILHVALVACFWPLMSSVEPAAIGKYLELFILFYSIFISFHSFYFTWLMGTAQMNSMRPSGMESGYCPDGLHPNPNDCQSFYNCAHGQQYQQQCGPGTVFNPYNRVCDWPNPSICQEYPTCAPCLGTQGQGSYGGYSSIDNQYSGYAPEESHPSEAGYSQFSSGYTSQESYRPNEAGYSHPNVGYGQEENYGPDTQSYSARSSWKYPLGTGY